MLIILKLIGHIVTEEDGKYFAFSTETIKDIYKSNNYVNPITNKSMEHLKERIEKVGKIIALDLKG